MGLAERKLERIVKGFANHRRIEILRLLDQSSDLSLEEIARRLRINLKTAHEHVRRIALGGLVEKRHKGRFVCHRLTTLGNKVHTFLKRIE